MKNLFRLALGAGLLSALLVGGSYACPNLTSRLGLNVAELVELQRRIEEGQRRAEELDHLSELVYQTIFRRQQVLQELRHHPLGLVETAARFRDISRPLPPNHLKMLRLAYSCATAEECYCRQVVYYLQSDAVFHPELTGLASGMQAELDRLVQSGSIRLPE